MTTWATGKVAEFAKQAGWHGDDLHEAVAMALAASDGADHYSHNPGISPESERRGLWAIRVSDVSPAEAVDLYDPEDNAEVARGIYIACGGHWRWHPVYQSGAGPALIPMVRLSLTRPAPHGMLQGSGSFERHLANTIALTEQIRNAIPSRGA